MYMWEKIKKGLKTICLDHKSKKIVTSASSVLASTYFEGYSTFVSTISQSNRSCFLKDLSFSKNIKFIGKTKKLSEITWTTIQTKGLVAKWVEAGYPYRQENPRKILIDNDEFLKLSFIEI